jgi:hypothetical protein
VSNYSIGGWDSAGKFRFLQDAVNLRRWGFEGKIILLMTMSTANSVEMLAFGLLWGQVGLAVAAGERCDNDPQES